MRYLQMSVWLLISSSSSIFINSKVNNIYSTRNFHWPVNRIHILIHCVYSGMTQLLITCAANTFCLGFVVI